MRCDQVSPLYLSGKKVVRTTRLYKEMHVGIRVMISVVAVLIFAIAIFWNCMDRDGKKMRQWQAEQDRIEAASGQDRSQDGASMINVETLPRYESSG